MRVDYPIALDSDYAIWQAFANHYWPAVYIADAEGRIRHHHFGEGGYAECEMVIQRLLREAGRDGVPDDVVSVAPDGFEAQADWTNLESPESYLGYEQGRSFGSPERAELDEPRTYTEPDTLRLNQWALAGEWTIERRACVLNGPDGRIAFRFHARDVHLVMGPRLRGSSVPFRVLVDGEPPGDAHGLDVTEQGHGTVDRAAAVPADPPARSDRRPHVRDRLRRAAASRPSCSRSARPGWVGRAARPTQPRRLLTRRAPSASSCRTRPG